MKIHELIYELSRYNPNATVKFHTFDQQNLNILSIYGGFSDNQDNKMELTSKKIHIDLGG